MKLVASILLTVIASTAVFAQTVQADLIVFNANLHTGVPGKPRARAIAVSGNKIVAIGTDAQINGLAGPKTRRIDAGGKTIVPGFNDAHVHFMETGSQLSSVDLR